MLLSSSSPPVESFMNFLAAEGDMCEEDERLKPESTQLTRSTAGQKTSQLGQQKSKGRGSVNERRVVKVVWFLQSMRMFQWKFVNLGGGSRSEPVLWKQCTSFGGPLDQVLDSQFGNFLLSLKLAAAAAAVAEVEIGQAAPVAEEETEQAAAEEETGQAAAAEAEKRRSIMSGAIAVGATGSWARASVKISPYTFSAIGIVVAIGVAVLGVAKF
ncbi:hypothetical protein M8C21_010601 [Ambrosia artemisiifolia]|uniref:Transmembrane protein n=1 Tax=Ambrosia artemisiifolia TaxID=4212 RepID=A0AAD5GYZ1_AMBAR|nr:hypothetical protein M8C21_010601 [Ambrosia artemisiifolia]